MTPTKLNLGQLAAQNLDLRTRLAGAEESLRGILGGEADALYVTGARGAQLFALQGTDQSYRAVVENMSEGAFTLTPAGLILYANQRFAEMLRTPLAKAIGSDIHAWVAPKSRRILELLLRSDFVDNRREELALIAADGTSVPVNLSVSHLILDMADAFCAVATDLTEQKRQEEIHAAEQLARAILEQSADAIVICDETGRIMLASNQAQAFYGKDPLGQQFEHAFPLRQMDDSAFSAIGVIDTSRRQSVEARVDHGGHRFDLLVSVGHLKGARGQLRGSVVTFTDITERRKSEERIRRLNRIYAVLSGINSLIVRVRDRDELFKEACRIAVEVGAFKMAWIGVIDPQTLDGKVVAWHGGEEGYVKMVRLTVREGTPDSDRPACRALRLMQPVICNDFATDPSMVLLRDELQKRGHKSAGCFPLLVAGRPEAVICLFASEAKFFDAEETRLLLELAGDISFALDHIAKAEKLNYLAYYDALTGLANHALFLERMAQYKLSARNGGYKVALYLVDLERFKNINDSFGRTAGDMLLRQVAEWLIRNVGNANWLARVGADRFAILLPEVTQDSEVTRLLKKSMAAFLEHSFCVNDHTFRIAAKVGVALFPDDGPVAETLFQHAEAALKKAKASGERYLIYTHQMTEATAGKLSLENKLRQAFDREEFVLHYQPKVNLASGKVTSAEALIRWNDPDTGLVPPGRFIPILEETGLIHDVGRWALRQAVADYLRWRLAGLPAVRIAVNVSALQLRSDGFIAEVEQAISVDRYAAQGLELEITESLIMDDVQHKVASLRAIRAMGVTIAIDDFGTGFSSLSYLAKLPVDTLKIDRSFVIDMTTGAGGMVLVSTIIALAHSLKLKVVAEGVETHEQSRLLRLLKCDEMQGFYFSKPVAAEEFETKFLAGLAGGPE